MEGLLKANQLPPEVQHALSREPWKVTSISQFANIFETKAEVGTVFCSKIEMFKERGDLTANLKQAWREAEAMIARGLKRTVDCVDAEGLDEPLKHDAHDKLEKCFAVTYNLTVPAVWMGFASMLGRLHREFVRRSHVVYHVNRVRNLEQITLAGPQMKHQKLGNMDISWGQTEQHAELSVSNVFTYLMGLKSVLYTMAVAGSFKVTREGKQVMFAPLAPLLNHLSLTESYVLRHSTARESRDRYSDQDILKQLIHCDESIRGEWARVIRTNEPDGVTLGEAIDHSKNFAAALLLIQPQRANIDHQQRQAQQSQPRRDPYIFPPDNMQGSPSRTQKGGKGGGKGKGKDKGKPFTSAFEKFDCKIKTARVNTKGEKLCKPFNDPRGCSNPSCRDKHQCDALLPTGNVCGRDSHSRNNHNGGTVPLY